MNYFKKNLSILILIIVSYGWVACNQSKNENTETSEKATGSVKPSVEAPDQFQSQIDKAVQSYLALKDAFVASGTAQTTAKAKELVGSLEQTDTTSLTVEVLQKWSGHKNTLLRSAQTLQSTQKLEEQRVLFEDVSKAMYALVNDFGSETTLYKQFCPMAFDDKGAFWLSAQSEIKNPYFGDRMLSCGEVQETLKFE